jgi:hypothetical protein
MPPCLSRVATTLIPLVLCIFVFSPVHGQMRQIYLDADSNNHIEKLSFYSPNEGYVAFDDWIGFTTDSGHTFTKKYIQLGNVNYGPYTDINVTFGYEINGVKAFDRNTLIVYGDYGLVPAILSSTDGGNTFTLVFYSQFNPLQLRTGITDISFPQNDNIGYAVDADRILKTTDKGLTWTVLNSNFTASYFNHIEAADDNNLIVLNTDVLDYVPNQTSRILKTTDGGITWSIINVPYLQGGTVTYACFLDANNGWISMTDNSWDRNFYGTTNGGFTWTQLNNTKATPFNCDKMKFVDPNTGYALVSPYQVYKTVNGGKIWEPLAADNSYTYLGYSNNDLQWLSPGQLWAGGGHGFLEMSTNGGGTPLPAPYFLVDTTGVFFTNTVTLTNFSRPGYQAQWIVNHQPVGNAYNATYTHDVTRSFDSIQLVNTSGGVSDTLTQVQYFFVPVFPHPGSFYPATGSTGTMITIKGSGFSAVTGASFGGVPATSVHVYGDTMVRAVLGAGATGSVTLLDFHGSYSLPGFTYAAPPASPAPVINSVNPASGAIGTTVTLSGTGFNGTPAQNSVFFGGVPATIQSASAGTIVCTIPAGAVYGKISVLRRTDGLNATSPQAFNVTFPDSVFNFTRETFTQAYTNDYVSQIGPVSVLPAKDLDGDGRPDLLAVSSGYHSPVVALRNISSKNHIQFAPPVSFGGTQYPTSGRDAADDLDGDGLPDYVQTSYTNYTTVYRNTSRPGAISFDTGFRVPAAITPDKFNDYNFQTLAAITADLDNDGRNDLAIATNGEPVGYSFVSVARNTSSPGSISFGPSQIVMNGPTPYVLAAGDLDGDGFRDIVTLNDGSTTQSTISCFRNTSTQGAISFATPISLSVPGFTLDWPNIFIADFDMDGKPDIVVTDDNYLCVFRNASTPGNLSFLPALLTTLLNDGETSSMANFTGSYRPDIVVGSATDRSFMWFKNQSSPGIFGIDSVMHYQAAPSASTFQNTAIGDYDQDGKPDLAVVYYYSNGSDFYIYHNTAGTPIPAPMCTTGNYGTQLIGDVPGKTHRWQVNTGSGFTNLSDNANVSGSATDTLNFTLPPIAWQGYRYRCVVDSFYSSTFVLQLDTVIDPGLIFTATDSSICYGKAVTFTATDSSNTSNRVFQFQVNGQDVSSSYPANTMTSYNLHDGDQVRVIMRYLGTCQDLHADTSRTLIMHVNETPDSVTITASATAVCEGTPVTFTATPLNPGTNPSYNWTVNGYSQGTNNPMFTSSSLANGSHVLVAMTSSAACAFPFTANSNAITMAVQDTAVLYVSIAASANNVCTGAPVTFTATTYNTGPSSAYQWVVNGADSGSGGKTFTSTGLRNNDQVRCILASTATCRVQNVATSNTLVMTVNNVVVPVITVTASDTGICTGQTAIFTAHPTGGGSSPQYQWEKNKIVVGGNTPSYSATGLSNGDAVTVLLTSNAACAQPDTASSTPLIMTVNPLPVVNLSGNPAVVAGAADTLSVLVSNAGAHPSYNWQDSTATHSWQDISGAGGAATLRYSPLDSGDAVRCIVTSDAGCTATSNAFRISVQKVKVGSSTGSSILFYPNPATATLYIVNEGPTDPIAAITIFNANGNVVMLLPNPNGQTKFSIDVGGLNPGMYYVQLYRNSGKTDHFSFLKK